jgi:hypothetical protein
VTCAILPARAVQEREIPREASPPRATTRNTTQGRGAPIPTEIFFRRITLRDRWSKLRAQDSRAYY